MKKVKESQILSFKNLIVFILILKYVRYINWLNTPIKNTTKHVNGAI